MDPARIGHRDPLRLTWTADGVRRHACFQPAGDDLKRVPCPEPPGLGDVVAGATTAAGVKPCGGCVRRKQAMNRLTPGWVKQMLHWLAQWLSRLAR